VQYSQCDDDVDLSSKKSDIKFSRYKNFVNPTIIQQIRLIITPSYQDSITVPPRNTSKRV